MPARIDMKKWVEQEKEKASKRGAASRRKGQCGEREVIRLIRPIIEDAYAAAGKEIPLLQRNTLQSDQGGCDLAGLEWLAIEVKYYTRASEANVRQWWAQCVTQAKPNQLPLLFFRVTRQPWQIMANVHVWPNPEPLRMIFPEDEFLRWFRIVAFQHLGAK